MRPPCHFSLRITATMTLWITSSLAGIGLGCLDSRPSSVASADTRPAKSNSLEYGEFHKQAHEREEIRPNDQAFILRHPRFVVFRFCTTQNNTAVKSATQNLQQFNTVRPKRMDPGGVGTIHRGLKDSVQPDRRLFNDDVDFIDLGPFVDYQRFGSG